MPSRTTSDIANIHFAAAISEAEANGANLDGVCRSLLGLIVSKYLESRTVEDVRSELHFIADNCSPETDFMFMRP